MIKLSNRDKTLTTSILISITLITLGAISNDPGVLGNFIIISAFIILVPQFLIRYRIYRELRDMEDKFPSFLRDLTESLTAGLPLHKGIISVSRINYGPLSKEVNKMSNQISWGMPLDKVLDQFSERIKSSKRMYLATKIMKESHFSGGDIKSTLNSLVEGQILLSETSKEKSSMMSQYVVLMYAITILFLVIIVFINKLMVPMFQMSQQVTEMGMTNPCNSCYGLECGICDVFGAVSSSIFNVEQDSISSYYISIFFFLSIVQSFFAGLVAGQISEGSVIAGLKHSLILVSMVFGVFSILVRIGLL
jgi:archaeal flagellar protein FlaJ